MSVQDIQLPYSIYFLKKKPKGFFDKIDRYTNIVKTSLDNNFMPIGKQDGWELIDNEVVLGWNQFRQIISDKSTDINQIPKGHHKIFVAIGYNEKGILVETRKYQIDIVPCDSEMGCGLGKTCEFEKESDDRGGGRCKIQAGGLTLYKIGTYKTTGIIGRNAKNKKKEGRMGWVAIKFNETQNKARKSEGRYDPPVPLERPEEGRERTQSNAETTILTNDPQNHLIMKTNKQTLNLMRRTMVDGLRKRNKPGGQLRAIEETSEEFKKSGAAIGKTGKEIADKATCLKLLLDIVNLIPWTVKKRIFKLANEKSDVNTAGKIAAIVTAVNAALVAGGFTAFSLGAIPTSIAVGSAWIWTVDSCNRSLKKGYDYEKKIWKKKKKKETWRVCHHPMNQYTTI